MIIGNSIKQLVATVKKSSAGIIGDFAPGYLVCIQVTFLKISAFYNFPGWHNFLANVPGLLRYNQFHCIWKWCL